MKLLHVQISMLIAGATIANEFVLLANELTQEMRFHRRLLVPLCFLTLVVKILFEYF